MAARPVNRFCAAAPPTTVPVTAAVDTTVALWAERRHATKTSAPDPHTDRIEIKRVRVHESKAPPASTLPVTRLWSGTDAQKPVNTPVAIARRSVHAALSYRTKTSRSSQHQSSFHMTISMNLSSHPDDPTFDSFDNNCGNSSSIDSSIALARGPA